MITRTPSLGFLMRDAFLVWRFRALIMMHETVVSVNWCDIIYETVQTLGCKCDRKSTLRIYCSNWVQFLICTKMKRNNYF